MQENTMSCLTQACYDWLKGDSKLHSYFQGRAKTLCRHSTRPVEELAKEMKFIVFGLHQDHQGDIFGVCGRCWAWVLERISYMSIAKEYVGIYKK